MKPTALPVASALALAIAALLTPTVHASSHREAPYITTKPKVDATDFYLFNSYERGRKGFVTLVANYQPLQDSYGGPNYFSMDPNAIYEIHVDNNGDALQDLTFRFRFTNTVNGIALPIGDQLVPIPLIQAGAVTGPRSASLNVNETFTVSLVRGASGKAQPITNASTGAAVFDKPADNIGTKTIADYVAYAAQHIYKVNIPGCTKPARLFVGQRKDPFAVNLGKIFDLINIPLADITDPTKIGAAANTIGDKNITSLEMEVHRSCLTSGSEPVIGGWTTAAVKSATVDLPGSRAAVVENNSRYTQVSRLGMPLVNEVVIGLPDKDKFNNAYPSGDGQFLTYVTNPTFPALFEIAQGITGVAPTNLPRNDLVTTFLTGLPGVNQPAGVVASEMMRLNTSTPPTPEAQQHRLGVVGGDAAGYPNGRRPKDDVVDITLVAAMGGLCFLNGDTNGLGLGTACKPSAVPLGATSLVVNDNVDQARESFMPGFPYLQTPIAGSAEEALRARRGAKR